LPDGSLLRPGNTNNTTFNAGGKVGLLKNRLNGNVTWTYNFGCFEMPTSRCKSFANGNILIIAWESKTNAEAIAQVGTQI
jgi:hypothetical protein